jgi:hypothetical protein
MLRVHHRHLAAVADLRGVALLRTHSIRSIRSGGVMLLVLVLGRSLTLNRLMMHRDTHVSLVFRGMR